MVLLVFYIFLNIVLSTSCGLHPMLRGDLQRAPLLYFKGIPLSTRHGFPLPVHPPPAFSFPGQHAPTLHPRDLPQPPPGVHQSPAWAPTLPPHLGFGLPQAEPPAPALTQATQMFSQVLNKFLTRPAPSSSPEPLPTFPPAPSPCPTIALLQHLQRLHLNAHRYLHLVLNLCHRRLHRHQRHLIHRDFPSSQPPQR